MARACADVTIQFECPVLATQGATAHADRRRPPVTTGAFGQPDRRHEALAQSEGGVSDFRTRYSCLGVL